MIAIAFKFAFIELHNKATHRVVAGFLRHLAGAVPHKISTILTDNGMHFTDPAGDGWSVSDIKTMRAEGILFRCHSFDAACADLGIEHRLTTALHPWTNGQVERMNRTIKEATLKSYHYDDHAQAQDSLIEIEDEGCCDADCREEGVGASVITGRDTAPIFEPAEHVFDPVPDRAACLPPTP